MVVGCGCSGPNTEGPSIGIATYEEFRPFVAPPADATLTLAAVPIQVSLIAVESGNKLTIDLKHDDRLVDREIYAHIGESVCLVHAAGENFEPPLPLLTFPMKIGSSWNWKGVTTLERAASPATAAVRTSVSKVAINEVMENAVEVDVDLEMNSDSPVKQKRNLKLWFVNGRGLVKRSFGEESVREPR